MCRKLIFLLSFAVLLSVASGVQAAVLEITPTAPEQGELDIANFVGAVSDINNVGTGSTGVYDNDVVTYIAHDRGGQGQTFVTGDNEAGYLITGVWVRHVGYTTDADTTWYSMQPDSQLDIRITDPAASDTNDFVLSSESYVITGEEDNALPADTVNDATGTGLWFHVTLDAPVALAASTEYGFDLTSISGLGPVFFFETLGIRDDADGGNPYPDGSAYVTGSAGAADNVLTPAPGDRVFVVELEAAAEPTGPKVIFVASVKDNDQDGIQDDQSWVDWLEAEGYYNVDARPGNWIDPLDPNKIAELEAADLIIAGRGMATGEYDGDEVAKWNALSTPILCTNAWMIRSNRWVWMNSTAANKDAGSPLMMAWVPDHPIFKGVPLDSDGLVDVLDPTVASGNTSFLNDILDVGNGTLLAQSLGIYNTTWLAEWDAGVEYYEGAGQIASGKRILFMAGTQDDPYLTESGLNQPVGVFNLNEAGQQLLRNIIKYLVPVKPVDPGTDGLVAYYAMENDVNDSSDNGLNGTILGDPNFVAGYEGMALDLDGDGDYVDCGYDPLFDVTTNEITVSAWVTIRSIANQWAAIAAKGEYAWRLGNASLDPRFHFGISIWNSPDTASIDGVAAVGYDEWHHVAGMFDGSNIMVYLDGVLDVSVATTEPIGVNDKSMLIGNNPDDPVRYWDGLIDELKIYDRALSEGELLYLAGYREPVAPVAPVHSYTFEDGTANDSVGDAHGFLVDAVVVDGAMVTTAQDQWMEMPGDMIAMNTYPEVTIEAWYTPEAGANTGWSMLGYFGDSVNDLGSNGYFMTSARGDDKSRAAISIGDEATPWASESGADGPEYDDGLLHHMVSTINATDITLYIDGVLIASTPLAEHNMISGISQNFAYLAKGGYGGDPEWIGAIDEFNIYNKALSAAQIAVNYAAGPVKPVQIAVENASFELPGTEKQNNWDGGTNDKGTFVDVPGWSSDTMATDSGVETGWNATDGEWSGFLRGSDPSAWQLTSYVIGAEDVIELKVDAKNNWQATTLLITLYYDEAGARVAAASVECALTDDIQEFSVVLSAADVPEAAGKLLGIELDNVTPDVDSWLGLDNVRLTK